MAYVPAQPNELERRLVWVDRNGVTQSIPAPARNYQHFALSPDGQQIALTTGANTMENWIYDLERGTLSRFTAEGSNLNPLWTPDGKRIAYRSERAGYRNIYWRAADGTDTEEQLTTGDNGQGPLSWSPDGKILAFRDSSPTTDDDIWMLPMDGRDAEPFLQTAFSEDWATFSPDGGWLAYQSDESGRNEIYGLPFPGPGRKWQVSTDGGTMPLWNPQGGELFYKAPDNKMMVVNVTTSPTFSAGRPRVLFEGLELIRGRSFDVAPDGQHFLAIQPVEPEVSSTQIHVVLNWFEELKRLVPIE